jgi:hypothetical protein
MKSEKLLQDAYDIHVHCEPDVVPRSQNLIAIEKSAARLGMAGVLLKEHATSTVGRAFALNRLPAAKIAFYSSLALNPPVGGINPCAVESALRAGVDVVYFPTYGARNHIRIWGAGKPPTAFPLPHERYRGISIFKRDQQLKPECEVIARLISRFDAVMATGHLSPQESLALLRLGRDCGVERLVVTHPSEPVTRFSLEQQKQAIDMGALIEHCFFAVTDSCPGDVALEEIGDQIRQIGVKHCILSSDLGQPANGPVVEGFAYYLRQLSNLGFSDEELRVMIVENPRRLLGDKPRSGL